MARQVAVFYECLKCGWITQDHRLLTTRQRCFDCEDAEPLTESEIALYWFTDSQIRRMSAEARHGD